MIKKLGTLIFAMLISSVMAFAIGCGDVRNDESQSGSSSSDTQNSESSTEDLSKVTKIDLSESDVVLSVGSTLDHILEVKGDDGNVISDGITWSSEDNGVVTVENGKLNAVAFGNTVVKAVYKDLEAVCNVHVNGSVALAESEEKPSLSLDNDIKLENFITDMQSFSYPVIKAVKGDKIQLNPNFVKLNKEDNEKFIYKVKYQDVATVNPYGELKALADGVTVVSVESEQIYTQKVSMGMGSIEADVPVKKEFILIVGEDKTTANLETFFTGVKDFEDGYDYTGEFTWKGFETDLSRDDLDAENTDWKKDNLVSYQGLMNLRLFINGSFCQRIYDFLPRTGWVKDVDESLPESTIGEALTKYGEAYRFPAGMLDVQCGKVVSYGDNLYLIYYHDMAATSLMDRVVYIGKVSDEEILNYRPIPFFAEYSEDVVYNLKERATFEAPVKLVGEKEILHEVGETTELYLYQGRKKLEGVMFIPMTPGVLSIEPGTNIATAVASGVADVMVMYDNYTKNTTLQYTVEIYKLIPNIEKQLCLVGEETQLNIIYNKDNSDITEKALWTSNDEKVVTVKNGLVTAVGSGETEIVCEYDNKVVSIKFTVRNEYRNYEEHNNVLLKDFRLDETDEYIKGYTKDEIIADLESGSKNEDKILGNESIEVQNYIKNLDMMYVVANYEIYETFSGFAGEYNLMFIQFAEGTDLKLITDELNSKVGTISNYETIPANKTFSYDEELNIVYKTCNQDMVAILKGEYIETDKEILSKDGKTLYVVKDPLVKEYTTPSGVEIIGERALAYLNKLEKLTISEGVTTIGYEAFIESGAKSSEDPYWVCELKLPSTVKTFGDRAMIRNQFGKLELNEGLETIGKCAFKGSSFRYIAPLPSTITSIGEYAFDTVNLDGTVDLSKTKIKVVPYGFIQGSSIEHVILPEGLKVIESRAFARCGVETINIPASVERIGTDAFYYEPNYSRDPMLEVYIDSASVTAGLTDRKTQIEIFEIHEDNGQISKDIKLKNFGGIVANVAKVYVKETIDQSSLGAFFSSEGVYKEVKSDKENYVLYTQVPNLSLN